MQTKKKITITIDEGLCEAVDQATKRFNLARSRLAQESFSLWLEKKTEASMAEGYREMADEDRKFSELTLEAQKEIHR
jgi:metal-responsive CopG/Arc/MetJ family transcriptional regulator